MNRQFGGVHPQGKSDKAKVLVISVSLLVVIFCGSLFLLIRSSSPGEAVAKKAATTPTVQQDNIKMVSVIIPLQEIRTGTKLEARMFRREKRPQVGIADRAVRSLEEVRGQFARLAIPPGQPLHRDLITPVKPPNQLTAAIPAGFRAVTIRVDARTSVEGFVRPDSKVDVIWASTIRGRPGVSVIVQNAKVLSAERSMDAEVQPGMQPPSTVTLLVSEKDSHKIQLASTTGKLSLSLRGDEDNSGGEGGTITLEELYGGVTNVPRNQRRQGTVSIGGKRYIVQQDGRLVKAEE